MSRDVDLLTLTYEFETSLEIATTPNAEPATAPTAIVRLSELRSYADALLARRARCFPQPSDCHEHRTDRKESGHDKHL